MSTRDPTLAQKWDLFRTMVIDANAPPIQLREMKRAFYAGASMWRDMMIMDVAELPDDDSERLLTALDNELTAYTQKIMRGED